MISKLKQVKISETLSKKKYKSIRKCAITHKYKHVKAKVLKMNL